MDKDDLLAYSWDAEKTTKSEDEKKSLAMLVDELAKENEADELDVERIDELKIAIGNKLGLMPTPQVEKWVEDILENIANKFNELEEDLLNHRHELNKNYSAKAEI